MPMVPDPVNELRRQRALLQQQLDSLDREIARAISGDVPTKVETETSDSIQAGNEPAPDEIITLKPDPIAASRNAKRGCLLYFVGLLALLATFLVVLYFWKYRDRPIFFPERNTSEINP